MTPELEALRIAVATELGWKRWTNDDNHAVALLKPTAEQEHYWKSCGCYVTDKEITKELSITVPEFTESLDACYEFEKDAPDEYWDILEEITCENEPLDGRYAIRMCRATPEQRCRAFLKWKGKVI